MTRINAGVRLRHLTDEHLLAEHREIKRLPSVYQKRKESPKGFKGLPETFTLGTGHVLFFIDKGAYTAGRYMMIHEECLDRGFKVENYFENWRVYNNADDDFIFNDYIPTFGAIEKVKERISERLMNSKKKCWHYYGKPITKQQAVKLLITGEL